MQVSQVTGQLGHIIDSNGITPDPPKTEAVLKMNSPSPITGFMGKINQLNKFSPHLAEVSQPLQQLLSPWIWTANHEEVFRKVSEEISSPRVLTMFNVDKESKISDESFSLWAWRCSSPLFMEMHGDQLHNMPLEHFPKLNPDMHKLKRKLSH